jgi:hypothetical protein
MKRGWLATAHRAVHDVRQDAVVERNPSRKKKLVRVLRDVPRSIKSKLRFASTAN